MTLQPGRDLTFSHHPIDGGFLALSRRLHLLGSHGDAVLAAAFAEGGYVAGGFGTLILRELLVKRSCVDRVDDDTVLRSAVWSYLGNVEIPLWAIASSGPIGLSRGDIDVWFPDNASWTRFMARTGSMEGVMFRSPSRVAQDLIVNRRIRFQVVHAFLRPLQEQLTGFDIFNGMVGLTDDGLTFPDGLLDLERAKTLHVHDWSSWMTINRTMRWLHRRGYDKVTQATLDGVIRSLDEAITWANLNPDKQQATSDKMKEALLDDDWKGVHRMFGPLVGRTAPDVVDVEGDAHRLRPGDAGDQASHATSRQHSYRRCTCRLNGFAQEAGSPSSPRRRPFSPRSSSRALTSSGSVAWSRCWAPTSRV